MAKQPIKKKKFDINSFKESKGLNVTKTNMVVSAADKPQDFIVMPEAFVEATKLPGIPMGVTTIIHGHSNTGKSLLKNCLIASAQKQGILPVIIETENNFSFPFAIDCDKLIGIRILKEDNTFDEISYGTRDSKSSKIISFKSTSEFNKFIRTLNLLKKTLDEQNNAENNDEE